MSGVQLQITQKMIDAGARLIERRTDLGKYTRRHLAEDIFKAMTSVGQVNSRAGNLVSDAEMSKTHVQSDKFLSMYKRILDSIFGNHQEKTNFADNVGVLSNIQNLHLSAVSWWQRLKAKSIGWAAKSHALAHGDDQQDL